jgi:hypothetical protein
MPIKTDKISQAPYFDDYNEDKKFHKILFRPGIPVQARELTQLQTILQNQIERFGDHVFKEGSMVIPGHIKFDPRVSFVRVQNETFHTKEWLERNAHNREFESPTGKKAIVLTSLLPFGSETSTLLYVKYLSGESTNEVEFIENEILTDANTGVQFTTISLNHKGVGTLAYIERGVFYIHGHFVLVNEQSIVVDPFSDTANARVGLQIFEEIVRPEDDFSLNDVAQGSPNFAAPGAHRLAIYALLTVKEISTIGDSSEEENFIELLRLIDGTEQLKVDVSDYNVLERTLARRTNDQSGSFTVNPFLLNVVDHPSDQNKLIAEISPGLAYVEGYEIRTIGKNTVEIDRARDTRFSNNAIIDTTFGNYVRVTDLFGMPNFKEFTEVNLYENPNQSRGTNPGTTGLIGTAKVRGIEFQSGNQAQTNAIYRLYLFDIQTIPGKKFEYVKYIYGNDAFFNEFSCRIRQVFVPMSGTISDKTGSQLSGIGTSWLQGTNRLREGDWIFIGGALNRFARISANPTSGQTIQIDDDVTFLDFSGQNYPFSIVYSDLEQTDKNSLIFYMPNGPVETIRGETKTAGDIDTSYTVRRQFAYEEVDLSNEVLLSTPSPNEAFASFSPTDYLITIASGTYNGQGIGTIIDASSEVTITPGTQNVRLTFSGTAIGLFVNVVASITKIQGSASKEKTKEKVLHFGPYGNENNTNLSEVKLRVADVFRLNKVCMSTSFSIPATSTDEDITHRFELDSGQRDNFYDLGRLILKPGEAKPTGALYVECEYFKHGGNGNYFSVDSYNIDYGEIPIYMSKESGIRYDLRDCLDFRPRVSNTGIGFTKSTNVDEASLTELPKSATRADYHFYLNRIDKLFLSRDGTFKIKKGISDVIPKTPSDADDGMTLYRLNVRAYTFEPNDIVQEIVENKRYTMRDIGRLEKRIENLEYYTSLTMLEKETRDLMITDSDGLDRFKNGFLVEPFTGHGVGDVLSAEYRCSIDFKERECRSLFVQDNINLVEFNPEKIQIEYQKLNEDLDINDPAVGAITSQPVLLNSYKITGDLVTLPFTEEVAVVQPFATNAVNVNPFAVFNFAGQIELNPGTDEWKDTKRLPDQIIQQEGNYDSMKQMAEGYGTIWGEWENQWTSTASRAEPLAHIMEVAQTEMRHVDNLGNPDGNFTNRRRDGTLEPWPVRHTFISRIITESATLQRREGVRMEVVPRTVTQSLGDRIVDVSYLPFMRTRDVQFKAFGLMPNTRVYAFFDDVDVNIYCSPWSDPKIPENFSSAKAGDPLVTDNTGSVSGTFKIPNKGGEQQFGAISFKTGQKVFRLTNRPNNDNKFNTIANATYTAQGIIETVQNTIISTRNADLQRTVVVDEPRVLFDRRETIDVQQGPWVDPIANTFLIPSKGGGFIPALDIFVESKDANIPLRVQIREVLNGYPSLNVVPFADITIPAADVNTNSIDNGVLYINGVAQPGEPTSDKFLGTRVEFSGGMPYLQQNTEYAIVILANSNNYTCWVATVGQVDPQTGIVYKQVGTDIPMTEQPYAGSFFKSQNSSTWTADQYANLMFTIYQCKFETNFDGIFTACNDPNDIQGFSVLDPNPFQTKSGSNRIRVKHLNHGHVKTDPGMFVHIRGVQGPVNGIPESEINGRHRIVDADLYSYIIDVTSNATISGFGGGAGIVASKCRTIDVIHPIISNVVLPDTNIECSFRTANKRTIHDRLGLELRNLLPDTSEFISLIANEDLRLSSPKQVVSVVNEFYTQGDRDFYPVNANLSPSPSLFFRCVLSTTNENVSPVIDLTRFSLISVGNKIDNPNSDPSESNVRRVNIPGIDDEEILEFVDPTNITFENNVISTTTDDEAIALSNLDAGKTIQISNLSVDKNGLYEVERVEFDADNLNCNVYLTKNMQGVLENGLVNTEIVQWNRFISERIPEKGTTTSKYITRRVVLSTPSTALRVSFGANRPFNSSIKLYYKVSPVDETTRFSDIPWSEANFDNLPSESTAYFNFKEYVATINNLPDFDIFAIKIVFTGENSSRVPRIIDLRAIALDE